MLEKLTKISRLPLFFACMCSALWTAPAQASFHLYQIVQIYSNADGTVQYVELFEPQSAGLNGQNLLAGFNLTGSTAFNIPSNLPSTTTLGTHVLFATQGFANLGLVTPDYIIPSGLVPVVGGSINYAGVDSVSFGALPTNGNAIGRDGVATPATPTNFSGKSATLAATFTPQAGFWYNPAEGGRGFVIEIHGSNLFIGGFMYDANGTAIWYASGPAAMVNATTYQNVWQQYGGGQSLTGAYKASSIVNANVGALTIQFTSATNGTMTLPTGTQIPITRFPF